MTTLLCAVFFCTTVIAVGLAFYACAWWREEHRRRRQHDETIARMWPLAVEGMAERMRRMGWDGGGE